MPVPSAVAASLAEELASLPPASSCCSRAAAVAGEPFEPDLAAAIAGVPPSDGLDALDALLGPRSRASDLGAATVRLSPPARATRGLRVRARRLEAGAHARAAAALAARGAAAAERAHHVEQSAGQGDEEAIGAPARRRSAPRRRGRPPPRRAGSRRRCACCQPDDERQVDVRVALASSLRALGELERCRATLLEAHRAAAARTRSTRRVELTARCAAVEHWLGRHEEAHRRLSRAWEELPDRSTRRGRGAADRARGRRPLRARLRAGGRDGPRGAGDGARASATALLIAAAAAALCLGETAAGHDRRRAREHRRGGASRGRAALGRRAGAAARGALPPRLGRDVPRALRRRGRARRARHRDRARHRRGPAARADDARPRTSRSRCRAGCAEAIELCETALEAARLSASPHELYRALFELGWTLYYAGDLDGAIAAHEESSRVDPRLAGGTIPNGGGGPGWGLGVAWFERARSSAGARSCSSSAETTSRARCPSSAASTGRASRSPSSRSANAEAAEATRAAPRRTPRGWRCSFRRACRPGARGGAARDAASRSRRRASRTSRPRPPRRSARTSRPRSRAASRGARSPPAGERREAIAMLRDGRARARRVRLDARAGRDAPRAAAARCARRAARAGGCGRQRHRLADASASSRSRASSPIA